MTRHRLGPALILIALCLSARPAASQETTRYAGDPMLLGAGARAQGMGSAFVAVSDDATAVYWNPAGLTRLATAEVQLQHAEQFGGTVNHDVLTVARPFKPATVGIGLLRVAVPGVSRTELEDPSRPPGPDNRPVVTRTVGTSDYTLHLSAGRHLRPDLSLGASLKLVWRDLSSGSGSGYGLDLGALYRPRPGLTVGLALRNLPRTTIAYDSGSKDRVPVSVLIGVAHTRPIAALGGQATVSASLHLGEEGSDAEGAQALHLGAEFLYRQRAAFRLGADGDHFTAGAGLRLGGRFGLDLAFLENGELDNSYRISASAYF